MIAGRFSNIDKLLSFAGKSKLRQGRPWMREIVWIERPGMTRMVSDGKDSRDGKRTYQIPSLRAQADVA